MKYRTIMNSIVVFHWIVPRYRQRTSNKISSKMYLIFFEHRFRFFKSYFYPTE